MAYEKQTWQTGDIITANKMNYIENGIAEINEEGEDMGYEKQVWQTGDIITAEKLNHIQDGIAALDGGGESIEPEMRVISIFNNTTHSVVPNSGLLKVNGSRIQRNAIVVLNKHFYKL